MDVRAFFFLPRTGVESNKWQRSLLFLCPKKGKSNISICTTTRLPRGSTKGQKIKAHNVRASNERLVDFAYTFDPRKMRLYFTLVGMYIIASSNNAWDPKSSIMFHVINNVDVLR